MAAAPALAELSLRCDTCGHTVTAPVTATEQVPIQHRRDAVVVQLQTDTTKVAKQVAAHRASGCPATHWTQHA